MSEILPIELTTSRLLLREPRIEDAARIFETYAQDEKVFRYLGRKPTTEQSTTEVFIGGCIQGRLEGNRFAYVLALPSVPETPIGMLDAKVDVHGIEIGYILARKYWGNGYMSEAVQAFTDEALAIEGNFRVQAFCDVDNISSARTLEKSGFQRDALLERYFVHPNLSEEPRACYLYSRSR